MLYQKFVKHTQTKKQKVYGLFALIVPAILLLCQPLAYSEEYVIVESENGDRLTGIWRGGTDTYFEIEYNGQALKLPVAGYTLKFTSDLAHVPDRTAAKDYDNGLALLELGLPELAQRRFEAAIEEYPRYPAAHYQLGLLYKANGDNANALERFRSAAILDAPSFDLVPFFHELGDTALANEDYAVAVDSYQLILTYYPEHEDVPVLSYLTGFLLVEQLEDYSTGLPLLELATKEYPDMAFHEKAFFLIGKLQAETDQLENALHTLEGFVTRYPGSEWIYEAHLIRAATNLKLGRLEEAASEAILVDDITDDVEIEERAKQILDQTRWIVYTDADGLPDSQIQAIASDDTRLWIGTLKGIMLFETAYDKWIPIEDVPQLINSALETVPDVRTIAVNPEEVWIGTRSQGAIHYNKLTSEIQTYSPIDGLPGWVRDIKVDETEIWFATDIGIIRQIRGSIDPPLVYNTQNSDLPANDIETLILTPNRVWCVSVEGVVGTFNREIQEWYTYHSTAIGEGMTIAGIGTAVEQLLFTWFDADEKSNGYFRADLDGGNGIKSTLHVGVDDENKLKNIYIRGAFDTSPIPEEPIAEEEIEEEAEEEAAKAEEEAEVTLLEEVEIEDPLESEFFDETEDVMDEQPLPPTPEVPLVLWIATNDMFYTHHTRSADEWEYTTTPRIVTGGLMAIQAFVVANNRAWIATANGLVTMSVQ
jgi:tetratricopeptide (TPR) repeat protein